MTGYRKVTELPEVIPVFPWTAPCSCLGASCPCAFFEPRYLNMIDDAMAGNRLIGMVQTGAASDRRRPKLARVGCVGRITSYAETGDGKYLIALTGVCRFCTGEELALPKPYRQVRAAYASFVDDLAQDDEAEEFERAPFMVLLRRYLDRKGLGVEWDTVASAPGPALVNSLCMALPFEPTEKQALLEAQGLDERRAALEALLEIDAVLSDDDDDAPTTLQ